ncbi:MULTISPECIES: nuclear transport factor 2 family protein [Microbacterium]|uniref:nuclear transport factor 2 family protein n=1 Tax=Microbacterium TaxID=33882 RepID=UPI000D651AD4|nr:MULTISPECIES: nuclear transport factor 2 family protein [Microbacterium]
MSSDTHEHLDLAARAYDQLAMQETLARYGWGFDEDDFDMLADTFTEEATSGGRVTGSDQSWGPSTGRDAIVTELRASRAAKNAQGRHTLHTFRFENQTSTSAVMHCYVLISSAQPGGMVISSAGWYRAEMVKESDGQWRMSSLEALLDSTFL